MENPNHANTHQQECLRKPYTRPQIEIVPLMPKQVVLGSGCYFPGISAGVIGACRAGGSGRQCNN
jgi:hypothetical protein